MGLGIFCICWRRHAVTGHLAVLSRNRGTIMMLSLQTCTNFIGTYLLQKLAAWMGASETGTLRRRRR